MVIFPDILRRAFLGATGELVAQADTPDAARTAMAAVGAGDVGDLVTDAIAADPDFADAATIAVTAAASGLDLVEGDDPRILQESVGSDFAWAVVDPTDRQAVVVYLDGSTRIFKLTASSIPDLSLEVGKLSTSLQSQLVGSGIGTMLQAVTDASGYVWALVDSNGRIGLGVKTDGTVVGKFLTVAADPPLVPEVTGTTPSRKLWVLNPTTGVRTLVTDTNDPQDAAPLSDGTILFTNANGRQARLTTGTVVPAYPNRTVISCWGDSLTKDGAWPEWIDANVSASVYNGGGSGQTTDEIAIRQGGYILQLTVTGGSIPTSGPVVCTTAQDFTLSQALWTQLGSLMGVPGTLARAEGDPANQFTFTRTSSGSAVTASGTPAFTSSSATTYESNLVIIAAGRNDHNQISVDQPGGYVADRVIAAHEAMVARIRSYHKEFLILGTCTPSDSFVGSFNYLRLHAVNDALAAKYGNRFCSYQSYLASTQILTDLGITPTSGDLLAIAGGTMPPSATINTGHFSPGAGEKIAEHVIKPKLDALGWLL